MSDTDQDYEALRQKNIADRNAFLGDFFKELKTDTDEINRLEKSKLSLTEKKNKTSKSNLRNRAGQFQGNKTSEILDEELKIDTDEINRSKKPLTEKKRNTLKSLKRKHKPSAKPLTYELRPRKARQFDDDDDEDDEDWLP